MPSFKKLVQFTVNAEGQLTAAAEDTTPVVKTDGSQVFTANQDMGSQKIVNAADPTSAQDYATKAYVDAHAVAPVTPGGALVLLEQHTASASASLDFTAAISSTFDEYLIECIDLVPTANADLIMRFSTNGGTSYDSSGIYSNAEYQVDQAAFSGTLNGGLVGTSVRFLNSASIVANNSVNGFARLFGPGSSLYKHVVSQFTGLKSDGNFFVNIAGARYTNTTAVNAFRIQFSTGNITSGTVRVYGVSKSTGSGGLAVASATNVNRSTSQTLTHAVEAAITFDTSVFDVDGMWSSGTNPTRLTARQTGKYFINGQIQLGTGFLGSIHVRVYKNGSVVARETYIGQNLSSGTESHGVNCLLSLTTGDYVELKVELDLQAGSGTFNVNGGADATFFSAFTTGGSGGTGDIKSDGSVPFAADESMGGHKITNLATPTLSTDAANKSYVDGLTAPAPVSARVYRSSAQSIPGGVDTALTLDTVDTDADGFWSGGAPTRLTVPSNDGGGYSVFAQVKWNFSGSGPVFLRLKKNGSTLLSESYVSITSSDGVIQLSSLIELVSGDYIELYINQQSGLSQNTVGGIAETYVALTKIGGGGGGSLPTTSAKGDTLASTGSEFDVQAVGGDKKVLTADSSQTLGVSWAYSGLTLLEQHALTGASVLFSSWLSSDFDEYLVEIVALVPATGGAVPELLMSTDGGSTFVGSYNYNWVSIPGLAAITGSIAAQLNLGDGIGGLATNGTLNGSFRFVQPSAQNPNFFGHITGHNAGNSFVTQIGGGYGATTTAINALKFQLSAGNFSAGTIRIYGVRK